MKKVSIILTLALLAVATSAWAQTIVNDVPYINESGQPATQNAIQLSCPPGEEDFKAGTTGQTTWFVLNDDITTGKQLKCYGNVNLILCDGKTLTINNSNNDAIKCSNNTEKASLTIYRQEGGTGAISATSSYAIGSGITTDYLTIHGGNLSFYGSDGIDAVESLVINGGTVNATGSSTGIFVSSTTAIINGGTVNAVCTAEFPAWYAIQCQSGLTFNGGNLNATANNGATGISTGTGGDLTIDYTDYLHDSFYASSYQIGGSFIVASGHYFIPQNENWHIVCGSFSAIDERANTLGGKTLVPYLPETWTGAGTEQSPFMIYTAAQLNLLAAHVNGNISDYSGKYFQLGNNISYTHTTNWNSTSSTENNFMAIGKYRASSYNRPFKGHFDGNNKTINGIRIYVEDGTEDITDHSNRGLFGAIGAGAVIENLTLTDARITARDYVGGIVGRNLETSNRTTTGGTVTNCHVTNTVAIHAIALESSLYNHNHYHGGIVGLNAGTVSGCTSAATLSMASGENTCLYYGGIAGQNQGTLSGNTVNGASITAYSYCGGIAGNNDVDGSISGNTVDGASVTASTTYCGGITGSSIQSVTNNLVFNTTIAATNYYGAIAGFKNGTLENNYYLACTVNGTPNATNVGLGDSNTVADATANDGALSLHTITKPGDVTIVTPEIVEYNSTQYWAYTNTVELSGGLNGTPTEGWQKAYFVDGTPNTYSGEWWHPSNYVTMPAHNIVITVSEIHADWATAQTGVSNDPYKIYFTDQLDLLATRINGSTASEYDGKYFKLMNDLAYNINETNNYTAIGSSMERPFQGHFDGNNKTISGINIDGNDSYRGVFGYLNGAEVSNLTVKNSIIHGNSYIGGVVGFNSLGSTLSNNLVVDVTLSNAIGHGAIAGDSQGSLTNNFYYGCIVGSTAQPTGIGCNGTDVTDNDGARPVFTLSVPDNVSANATPTVTYNVANYYKEGVSVSLNGGLSGTPVNPGTQLTYYVYGAALLSSNLTPTNTFNMQAGDAVVTVDEAPADWAAEQGAGDTEENPYKIYYTEQLDLLATCVNSGTDYAGKYFKLMNNLTYDNTKQNNYTAIGNSQALPFRGHFDGNNKTISGIRIYKSGDSHGDQWQAVFGYLNDSTSEVKNLTVADADITAYNFAGGIVGFLEGGTITNCHATSTVFIRAVAANANSHGGIVGDATAYNTVSEISHCTSSVTLTNTSSGNVKYYGAIAGAIRSGVTMSDNFAIGATVPSCAENDHGALVGYNNGATLARNYYHNCTVAGIANATNKGCHNANVVENDGAMPVFTLSTATGITAEAEVTFTRDAVDYYKLGTLVTLSCTTPPPAGYYYVFSVNGTSIAGNTFDMEANSNVSVATEIIDWANAYSGTACDPYLIGNATQWDALAASVNNGMPYGDAFFKLTADISINTIVGDFTNNDGDHYYPFSGTFDGNGHTLNISLNHLSSLSSEYVAPFACISGATIKNLHITGYVTTNGQRPASITSFVVENSTITNCWSEVDISSSYDKDIDAGGLVARVNANKTVTITDCLFSGRITYSDKDGFEGGGMVGYTQDGATAKLTNCYFAPSSISFEKDSNLKMYMFVGGEREHVNINNCYYNDVAASHPKLTSQSGTNASNVSSAILLNLLGNGWEIKDLKVVPIITPYTFSGEGTEESPYIIASETDWNGLANNVYLGEIHSCDHFKMSNDISVTTMVGSHPDENTYISFDGTFDGDGHTLNVTLSGSGDCTAPFTCISGATIKNLHITGTIATTGMRPASIASFVVDNSTISNCWSEVAISSSHNDDIDAGGFVARVDKNKSVTLDGCLFTGSITYSDNNGYQGGGMVGWTQDGAYATLNNCYFAPSSVSFVKDSDLEMYMFIGGKRNHVTLTNCYYNDVAAAQTKLTPEDKRAYSITGGSGVSVENAGNPTPYNVSGITSYGTGIKYNNVLYAGNGDNVSLNLSVPEGYVISGNYSASAGTLTGTSSPYTLTMPNENVIITADATLITIYREIEGYGDGNDHWAFIASPVEGSIEPTVVSGLIADPATDYDLYRLNPTNTIWENYKEHEGNAAPNFTLKNGRGYLYATKTTKTLAFSGTFNTGAEPMTITDLPAGYNLVGNPFTVDAYVSKPYYTLNSDGSAILTETSSNAIPPCYGVIVEVGESETVTFNTSGEFSAGPNNGGLNIALTQANTRSNTLLDNAIVSFNEDSQLGKFYFGTQNANIYIPQYGEEYAIASSDKHGEMPLNFKAVSDGTYTLTVNPESTEMAYLHLIDNLTGNDVDLLVNPSYTFTGHTYEYASRFKLVFMANDANLDGENNDDFAFISNGQLIVLGEGTLQVVDMMGRVISTEIVNGTSSKAINARAGVYVLQLIKGENVKTKKIVVR